MIFFDIDETLIEYLSCQNQAAKDFAIQHPQYIDDPDEFAPRWHQITHHHHERELRGETTFQGQRRDRIREAFGASISDEEADQYFQVYHQCYLDSLCIYPETIEVLEKLKHLELGIITNGNLKLQIYKLKKMKIYHYFKHITTPACIGLGKPHSDIYHHAAYKSNKDPQMCWYVGDDYHKDYIGAKQSGFHAMWINRFSEDHACDLQGKSLVDFVEHYLQGDG